MLTMSRLPTPAELYAELAQIAENAKHGIADDHQGQDRPDAKELIWTLNKAKLYRYIPVVPPSSATASHC